MQKKKVIMNLQNFLKSELSFKTQLKIKFLLPDTGSRKVFWIMPEPRQKECLNN